MLMKPAFCLSALLCIAVTATHAQTVDSVADKLTHFPMRLFGHVQSKTAALSQRLQRQTQKYLQQLQNEEARLEGKIFALDSGSAKTLFANSSQQYAQLLNKLQSDTGSAHPKLTGQYQPYTDSLQTALAFFQKNPQVLGQSANTSVPGNPSLSPEVQAQLQSSITQLRALQAKMQDAGQIKAYMQQRKQLISQYIASHTNVQGLLNKPFAGMQRTMYYYSAQVNQYRTMLNSPDRLEQKAMAMLVRLPSFGSFMKVHSQLSSIFSLPGGTSSPLVIAGLQTRSQVSDAVKGQLTAAASGSNQNNNSANTSAAFPGNAQSQLAVYKAKLSQLGGGSSDIDAPNFRPNDQKTKTFLHRLQYGVDIQTTQGTYYFPTMTSLGLSLGYRLGHGNDFGVGAAMKIGWGTGFNHIVITGQGVGLRTFVDIHIKNSWSATGGFEYNYTQPFAEYQQIRQIQEWTKSGLVGVSKSVSMKSRLLKQTKLSLLWDFLSYQAVPKTEPLIFRVSYGF
jgi:Skp family chaperone for outer membrane proteins